MHIFYQTLLSSPQDNPESSDKAKLLSLKLMEFKRPSTDGSVPSAIRLLSNGMCNLHLQAWKHFDCYSTW